jgi:cysteine desulfurase
MNRIYLDHAATTPLHPEVLNAMLPFFHERFGNPSSLHAFGRDARNALNAARDLITDCLHCDPGQLIFTSGGTESDNMAIFGSVLAQGAHEKKHVITSQVEHQAVLYACRQLEQFGVDVTYLPVDAFGRVSAQDVEAAIRPETKFISIMFGNNETGTLQPIEEIGRIAGEKGIVFHADAVQALGSVAIHINDLPVDLMSFSSHKINGPKGTGLLYTGKGVKISPLLVGGSQERKRRAGTENVAGIAGFAEAVRISVSDLQNKAASLNALRNVMLQVLRERLGEDGFIINGHEADRLPHILNMSFPGIATDTMLMNLDLEGIAAASGSACTSGSLELSHVLEAMCLPESVAASAVRFSFGYGNTVSEVKSAAKKIATIVRRLRNK